MSEKKTAVWYERYIGRIVPRYAFFSVIFCFIFNSLIYTGTQIIMADAKHYDLTTSLDRSIPFVKEWIFIYLICFLFWAVNYILITRRGKKEWFQFAAGDYLSRIICGILFVLVPTTNVRPEVAGNDIFSILVRFVYAADAPTNLFPSIHCLVSWLCFAGIRGDKKIPKWYKVFSCVFAILVCLSTQFTKQHYALDIFGGILIAEICYYIGRHTKLSEVAEKIFARLNMRVFGD